MIANAALNRIPCTLNVEAITDFQSFLDLKGPWDSLVDEAGIDHPFLSHDWVRTWWECFGRGKRLHLLVVKEGTKPVALAPLMYSPAWMYGLPVRRLEFIYNDHTPRCDFAVLRRAPEVYRTIWHHLLDVRSTWDILKLPQLVAGSSTLEFLQKFARAEGLPIGSWPSTESPYLTLKGTWDDYFRNLDRKHRSNIRNRLNRLDKLGTVELQVVSSAAEAERSLDEGLAIEAKAWKGRAGSAIICRPDLHEFYRRVAIRTAERGWLRLHFLAVNGRRIAFDYSLLYKKRMYVLKPGYDPEFSALSPYNSLCYMKLKAAFEQGLAEYDFLGMKDDWKLDWTGEIRPHSWLFIFSDRLRSTLVHCAKFRLGPALKRYGWVRDLRDSAAHIFNRDGI